MDNPTEKTVTLANGAKVNGQLSFEWFGNNATALTQLLSLPNNYGISVGASIQGAYQERDTLSVVKTGNGTGGQYGCSTSISNQGGTCIVLMSQHNGRCDGESTSFSLDMF